MATNPVKWVDEADVIVVGYGGAGAATAITAHDAGARVLIIEKQPPDADKCTNHTPNSRMSAGGFLCPNDPEQAANHFLALRRVANESIDSDEEEALRALADRLVDNTNWIQSIGGVLGGEEDMSKTPPRDTKKVKVGNATALNWADFPILPGANSMFAFYPKALPGYRHGAAFFKYLTNAIEKRGIPILWNTSVQHLVMENGAARGVIGQMNKKTVAVRATRGVVLSCGGFASNDWLKAQYLRPLPLHFYGSPAKQGEGITMAIEAGAALWHMSCISARVTMKFPDHPIAFGTQHHSQKGIFVDKRGFRFANESFKQHSFGYELSGYDTYAMCYPRVPIYWVFDEKRRKSGPLASYHGACNPPRNVMGPIHYVWSEDNLAEVDKGWIWKANTIEAIAHKIGADPDDNGLMTQSNLKATVQRYNELCRAGEDTDFHRPASTLAPLEDPPYYVVKLWPGGPNTQGGPRRNKHCQVLRPDGTVIPRLYGAGELGSFFAMLYQGGGNLGECIANGRAAGEHSATEKLWK